jgi:hypothetical protein
MAAVPKIKMVPSSSYLRIERQTLHTYLIGGKDSGGNKASY